MRTAGLLDLQVNGYAGVDFNDDVVTASAMDRALEAMRASGVTQCLPTLITAPLDVMDARLRALDAAVAASRLGPSMVPGYHLEGPFLNAEAGYCGCHPADAMRDPDAGAMLDMGTDLSRPVLLVTLAAERAGALEATAALSSAGVIVGVGHSSALFGDVGAFADAGGTLSTHLGNGLPASLPKLENTVLAQTAEPRLMACLIADGIHVPREALAALVRLKGRGRCALVTDAVCAAAAPPGRYVFAGMEVELGHDGAVRVPGQGGLAGSALRLDDAVRNVVRWGIADAAGAVEMASDAPRRALAAGLARRGFRIDPGAVTWDDGLSPTVVLDGTVG